MGSPEPAATTRPVYVAAFGLVVAAAVWTGLHPIADLDLWWHMRLGEQMLATSSLVPADPFSHTSHGAAWPWKDAGFALLSCALWSLGGSAAIVIAKAIAFALATGLAWIVVARRRRTPPALALVVVALVVDGLAFRFTERAATLSLVIAIAVLVLLERDRRGARGIGLVVPLTVLNANLHRGAIVLPALMAAYAIVRAIESRRDPSIRLRAPAIVALLCPLACLATPFGMAIVSTTTTLVDEHTAMLTEWAPVSAELVWALTPSTFAMLAAVLAGAALSLRYARPLPWWDLVLVALALALGLASMRHLPYLAIFGMGPAASGLSYLRAAWTGRLAPAIALAAGATALASAMARPLATPSLGLAPAHFPERGVEFVQSLPEPLRLRGAMFNEFGYGGFLVFHLWPEHRVFIDGRTDLVYPAERVREYVAALHDPRAFAETAERWGIEWVLLDHAPHDRGRAHFDADPRWVLVHASRRALVYVRRDGENAALADARGYRYVWPHDLDGSLARAARSGHAADALAELRRMIEEDPDDLYAVAALARVAGRP